MNTSVITILTGAGFSVPAGFPTAKQLGEILLSTKERDYFFHSDQVLYPNTSGVEVEAISSDPLETWPKLLSFLKLYASGRNSQFDYEEFFDVINHVAEEMPLTIRTKVLGRDCRNASHVEMLKQSMIRVFQQLVKYQLLTHSESFEKYDGFVKILKAFSIDNCINVYTLNHDTFMERLLSSSGVDFSDGFSGDSLYYYQPSGSDVKKKVQVYKDAYLGDGIMLHKLHGSINYFKSYLATGVIQSGLSEYRAVDVIKCNGTMGGDMYIKTDSGYKSCFALDPLFLSGTRSKIENYGGLYINRQMQHFQEDILKSDILLVIGYGFADFKINEFILNNLRQNTRVIVIDKYLTIEDVMNRLNGPIGMDVTVHTGLGVEDISTSILQ